MSNAISAATARVLAQEEKRGDALRCGDAAALAAVLSDDLRYTHSNGKFETKADAVNAIASKAVVFERFRTSDLCAVAVTDEVVVLTGRIDQCKTGGGKRQAAKLLFHSVWRPEAGTWRMVSLQTAMLSQA